MVELYKQTGQLTVELDRLKKIWIFDRTIFRGTVAGMEIYNMIPS
jgi:hypothetical protein